MMLAMRSSFRRASLGRRWLVQSMDMGGGEMKAGEALAKYTRDLTEIARNGRSDPVIGRSQEIQRTIQVLSRRTKNNPLLLGAPGTGKTALVEGLAQRIVSGEVPDSIKDKRLLSLDLSDLVAGASFRGEFEKRFKSLLKDVESEQGKLILFADEIHQLVGMGSVGEGAMDAANMLKPALARGDLRLVGATTFDEYRKYIEKDQALTRRFQPVFISEPTVPDAIAILRGLKEKYELWHGVRITDSAVVAAATYAKRFLTDRKLPDSAIDLMDEATSRLRMEKESKPEPLATLDRDILTMCIELAALKRETEPESVERRQMLERQLAEKQEEAEQQAIVWMSERDRRSKAKLIQSKLDDARRSLEQAQTRGDYAKAGELKYGTIPELETEVSELAPLLQSEAVTEGDIAAVISSQTGIPVSRLLIGEKERLLNMENRLRDRVIGQDEALQSVSDAIRISRAGLHSPNKPIGCFMFLGTSGCGKTELAKALAEFLFDDESAMVRIDMSEYGERHSVSRLIGAPPGYVGYDEGGQLTEPVRRRPYSVILLDEIEKSHREVCNILLQVLDEGRLTDGTGKVVDFKNTVLILTSNLGTRQVDSDAPAEYRRSLVTQAVKEHFPPEFVNRLDELVIFNDLSLSDIRRICDVLLGTLKKQMMTEKRIRFEVDETVRDHLANIGFDPQFGARPLKRCIQRELLNPLAKFLLSDQAQKGDVIRASRIVNGEVRFDVEHEQNPSTTLVKDVATSS